MTTQELFEAIKKTYRPNKGIIAIAQKDCCIMDELCTCYPYKEKGRCPDYNRCDDEEYLLACLATRSPEEISPWVVTTYSEAMIDQ